jgi:hypothetical protein
MATTVQHWAIRRGGEPLYLFIFDQECKQEFDVRDTSGQVEQDRSDLAYSPVRDGRIYGTAARAQTLGIRCFRRIGRYGAVQCRAVQYSVQGLLG